MPESTINTIITAVGSLLGAIIGAAATILAARVKTSTTSTGGSKFPIWGIVIGAFIGACITVSILAVVALSGIFGGGGGDTPPDVGPSTINVYDSFDNSAYDGSINQAAWVVNGDDNMSIYQENGRLVILASTPTDYGALWLTPTNGLQASIQSFNLFEAGFSWDPAVYNKLYLGVTAQHSWTETGTVAYTCDFILTNETSIFHCNGVDGDETAQSTDVSLSSGQTYTIRMEIDPESAVFSTYLNDSLVNTYQPPNPEKWKTEPISYNVHLGTDPLSSGTVYIDDVVFGKK
ncbi:MAG TPA: hypothetical protein PKL78_11255 [Anaerolineales bacterium]|nr:hypothetical protein [Anaerolineales bacterium]